VSTQTVDERMNLPATPSEEMKNRIQLQKMQEQTVESGVVRLSVKRVTMAENSESIAIDLDHPIAGELRVFKDKPKQGWTTDNELVALMKDWYGMSTTNPYALQQYMLYVVHDPDGSEYAHDWRLADPRQYDPSRMSRRRRYRESLTDRLEAAYDGTFAPWMITFGLLTLATYGVLSLGLPTVAGLVITFAIQIVVVIVVGQVFHE